MHLIFLFFLSASQKGLLTHSYLSREISTFKTCSWLPWNTTQDLAPNSFCPVAVSFAEGMGREEKAACRSLLCWALVPYLRSQPLCHRSCFPSFWPLDKSHSVRYTKWVQVSWQYQPFLGIRAEAIKVIILHLEIIDKNNILVRSAQSWFAVMSAAGKNQFR